jgi:hypothetical protein
MADNMDIIGAVGKGALAGAGTGATIGSVVPGIGTAIGAAGGAIIGGVASGLKQNTANKAQQIPIVDPMERNRLAQLEQQRKSLLSGTDAVTQSQIGDIKNIGAGVQGAITRNTGGDVSSALDALLRAQKNTQSSVNQAVVQGRERLPYFDNASGALMQRIAQRRLELDLLKRNQKVAENAQSRKDANVSGNAVASSGILEGSMGSFQSPSNNYVDPNLANIDSGALNFGANVMPGLLPV